MGMILQFPKQRRVEYRDRIETPGRTGEILIFTGVRYERWPEEEKPKPRRRAGPAKRGKRKRQA